MKLQRSAPYVPPLIVGVLVMMCVLHTAPCALAQPPLDTYTYAATPADYRYLWYGKIVNEFDSARLQCVLGEIEVVAGEQRTRINLRLTEEQWQAEWHPVLVAGQTTGGRDATLEEYIRTEKFVLPNRLGEINYFRMASVEERTPCKEERKSADGPPNTWRESQLALTKASYVQEETRFVLELVNVTDNTVVTIDSLRIPAGTAGQMMIRGEGASLHRVQHSFTYPTSMYGDSVYLRWVPYRYGTAQRSVAATMMPVNFQWSAIHSDTTVTWPSKPRWFSEAVSDSIWTIYATKMLQRQLAEPFSTCGKVNFGFSGLPPAIHEWYYDSLRAHGIANPSYTECEVSWYDDSSEVRGTLYPNIGLPKRPWVRPVVVSDIHLIVLNSVLKGKTTIHAAGNVGNGRLTLEDLKGRVVRNVWSGQGPSAIDVDVEDLTPGPYLLVLHSERREGWLSQVMKVMVEN